MIIFSHRQDCRDYLEQYFILRKNIFCDSLEWVKPNADGTETDRLDEEQSYYILFANPVTDEVQGGLRLVPTIGNTLIHTVWSDLLPERDDFCSPCIWEVSRFCVRKAANPPRYGGLINRVSLSLLLAIPVFAAEFGISLFIAVCHDRLIHLFKVIGFPPDVIATKKDICGQDLSSVIWPAGLEFVNNPRLMQQADEPRQMPDLRAFHRGQGLPVIGNC